MLDSRYNYNERYGFNFPMLSDTSFTIDDIDNQSAVKIAKDLDPNGVRTIGLQISTSNSDGSGVLTKADTVQDGDFPQWAKILNSERYILRRGYYATRLPGASPKETKWSWEEAREKERIFFSHPPWNRFKHRLGIPCLTEALSSALAELISARCIPLCNTR